MNDEQRKTDFVHRSSFIVHRFDAARSGLKFRGDDTPGSQSLTRGFTLATRFAGSKTQQSSMEPSSENLRRQNLLSRWGLTVEELTHIVDANPSMRGLMLGYVAEYKLRKIHFSDPRFSEIRKDDDHDRKQKGDIRLTYRAQTFRIECKSLQKNSIKVTEAGFKGTFQCDASDRRPVRFEDGSTVETTCLLIGEFDIVAVNLFSFLLLPFLCWPCK